METLQTSFRAFFLFQIVVFLHDQISLALEALRRERLFMTERCDDAIKLPSTSAVSLKKSTRVSPPDVQEIKKKN